MQQLVRRGWGLGGDVAHIVLKGLSPPGTVPPNTFGEWHDPFLSVLRVI